MKNYQNNLGQKQQIIQKAKPGKSQMSTPGRLELQIAKIPKVVYNFFSFKSKKILLTY
jgi:hypothetical protein